MECGYGITISGRFNFVNFEFDGENLNKPLNERQSKRQEIMSLR